MKILNIEVNEVAVERFSKDNFVSLLLETVDGTYDINLSVTGVSNIKFWEDNYGVYGSPVWVESNVHDVVDHTVLCVYDEYGDEVVNPEIISAIDDVVSNYDFTDINESIAESILNGIGKEYD